ncbi:hypothetical protein F5Y10DRAFT_241226 [Nemania abortiva]|nr:hypothetical protein F5Y10DRAFT_241226 [Nemania abortiva]
MQRLIITMGILFYFGRAVGCYLHLNPGKGLREKFLAAVCGFELPRWVAARWCSVFFNLVRLYIPWGGPLVAYSAPV